MSIAIIATGTQWQLGSTSGSGGSFTRIPEISRLTAPSIKFDLNDVSSHDSEDGYREWLPGFKDGDNVTGEANWVPSNSIDQDVRDAANGAELRGHRLIFPDISDNTLDFNAYITDLSLTANAGEPLKATITAKVTGAPSWS